MHTGNGLLRDGLKSTVQHVQSWGKPQNDVVSQEDTGGVWDDIPDTEDEEPVPGAHGDCVVPEDSHVTADIGHQGMLFLQLKKEEFF